MMPTKVYGPTTASEDSTNHLGDVVHNHFGTTINIAKSCSSLEHEVDSSLMLIRAFVPRVRGSRRDMESICGELQSLQLCLGTLRGDLQKQEMPFDSGQVRNIEQALVNCELSLKGVDKLFTRAPDGKMQPSTSWTQEQKHDAQALRSSLKANKSTLELALTNATISVLAKQVVQLLKRETDAAKVLTNTETTLSGIDRITALLTLMDSKMDNLGSHHSEQTQLRQIRLELDELQDQVTDLTHDTETYEPISSTDSGSISYRSRSINSSATDVQSLLSRISLDTDAAVSTTSQSSRLPSTSSRSSQNRHHKTRSSSRNTQPAKQGMDKSNTPTTSTPLAGRSSARRWSISSNASEISLGTKKRELKSRVDRLNRDIDEREALLEKLRTKSASEGIIANELERPDEPMLGLDKSHLDAEPWIASMYQERKLKARRPPQTEPGSADADKVVPTPIKEHFTNTTGIQTTKFEKEVATVQEHKSQEDVKSEHSSKKSARSETKKRSRLLSSLAFSPAFHATGGV